MIQRAGLGAERVLITGASGGVGAAAVQLAKRRGAHVTAVTRPEKMNALRELGADSALARDDAVPEHAYDVVLDLVGGRAGRSCSRRWSRGGATRPRAPSLDRSSSSTSGPSTSTI